MTLWAILIDQSPLSPAFHIVLFDKRKGLEDCCSSSVYFLLLRANAAAAAIMITIARPMAMYVAVGAAFVGGIITGLGVGATVIVGAVVGVIVVAGVGGAVGLTAADAAAGGAWPTYRAVSACEE